MPKTLKDFFFQAEDGIRDHCVTGVQTCALPIYLRAHLQWRHLAAGPQVGQYPFGGLPVPAPQGQVELADQAVAEIGRASCRERVWIRVGEGPLKRTVRSRKGQWESCRQRRDCRK